ncbi:MAG: heavy metal-binding domain-containing protein [Lachnospiraceae bacterium]|nr:heavy metal-binding domain-containing protein [Lachnospiraceae bacterium]
MVKNCPNCGNKITEEMIEANMCWECGYIFDKSQLDEQTLLDIEEQSIENNPYSNEDIKNHKLTTTNSFVETTIKEYKGLVSGEIVLGTGFLSDFKSGLSDLFGVESKAYSNKIKEAKRLAVLEMIKESISMEGNAIVGVSYQIVPYAGSNMIMVSVNGTSVVIEKSSD